MARVRTAKYPKPGELEADEPEAPKISQAEAVRQAIAAGMDAPADGVEFIKAQFGIEMDNKRFSLAKSQQKLRDAKKEAAAPKGRPGRKPAATEAPARPAKSTGGDIIADIEAVKSLIDKHGADGVKRLVDALG